MEKCGIIKKRINGGWNMDTKKLSKLKSEFRKRIALEPGKKAILGRDNQIVKIHYKGREMFPLVVSLTIYHNVLVVQTLSKYFYIDDFCKLMEHYGVPYAKLNGVEAIFFNNNDAQTKEGLGKIGFVPISTLMEKEEWNKTLLSYARKKSPILHEYVYLPLKKDDLLKRFSYDQTLLGALQAIKEKDPTFSYTFEVYDGENAIKLRYYCEGIKGALDYVIQYPCVLIAEKEEEERSWVVEGKTQIQEWLFEYFKKIANRQKLKNIFEHPMDHFALYINTHLNCKGHVIKQLFTHLTNQHAPKNIEIYFADKKEKPKTFKYYAIPQKCVELVQLMEQWFVIVNDEDVHSCNNYQEGKTKVKEISLNIVQKDLQAKFTLFEQ